MKIGILGTGNVGSALGKRLAQAGHEVKFGARNPDSPEVATLKQEAGANASAGPTAEAIEFGEAVIFALPYSAIEGIVEEAGDGFGEKILIDCVNPISADFSGLDCEGDSAAEQLAKWSGSSRVVKCFNTVGSNIMDNPDFGGTPATMLYCGDDAEAKSIVAGLAAEIGFAPVDAGPLLQAKWLESLAWLWISMALKFGQGREMAFVLHKRQ